MAEEVYWWILDSTGAPVVQQVLIHHIITHTQGYGSVSLEFAFQMENTHSKFT